MEQRSAGHPAGTAGPAGTGRPAWHALHLWQIQPLRDALLLAAIFGLLYLGYQLSTVTVPVLLALLLAYLFEPLVQWTTKKFKVSRGFVAAMIIIGASLAVVVPAGLGLTFGVLQGASLAEEQVSNLQSLLRSVDQPEDPALRAALPSQRWRSLRDWLIKQEAKAKWNAAISSAKRAALEGPAVQGPDTPVPPSPAPVTQPDAPASVPPGGTGSSPTNNSGVPELTPGQELTPGAHSPDIADTTPTNASGVIEQSLSGAVAEATTRAVQALRANTTEIGKGAFQLGANLLSSALAILITLGRIAFGAFLTGFFFYFFCTGWGTVQRFWHGLVPEDRKKRVFLLVTKMDRVVAGFVRGRLTICGIQMIFFTLGYWIIGCPAPLIVGPLVGLLTLVPYAAGLAMPIIMVLMALNPDSSGGFMTAWWWIVGAPIVLQGISQLMDDYVLSPTIQGKNTDLSMPLILFASIAGGLLAGFYGLLVAIPVAACTKILFEDVVMPKFQAWAKGEARDPLPIGRE